MENCGRSKVSSENKIVGGRNAMPGEFPWQVRNLNSFSKLKTFIKIKETF